MDIELSRRRYIARPSDTPADHDQPPERRGKTRVALHRTGDVGERTQGNDRHLVGGSLHFIAEHFFRRMDVV